MVTAFGFNAGGRCAKPVSKSPSGIAADANTVRKGDDLSKKPAGGPRSSYTVTMRSIIPAREALASLINVRARRARAGGQIAGSAAPGPPAPRAGDAAKLPG